MIVIPKNLSRPELNYLESLAAQFNLPIDYRALKHKLFYLSWNDKRINLINIINKQAIFTDFTQQKIVRRTKHNQGELLVKATNIKSHRMVWDATAGLGQDAFVLAAFGANVHLFERNPIAAILLQDGLNRAQQNQQIAAIANNMTFHFHSITDFKTNLSGIDYPNTIYLDPMFPTRKKTAAVKKEMTVFQSIIGQDDDADDLLTYALTIAKNRIVVKRPKISATLNALKADFQYSGKSVRFDCYNPKNKEY